MLFNIRKLGAIKFHTAKELASFYLDLFRQNSYICVQYAKRNLAMRFQNSLSFKIQKPIFFAFLTKKVICFVLRLMPRKHVTRTEMFRTLRGRMSKWVKTSHISNKILIFNQFIITPDEVQQAFFDNFFSKTEQNFSKKWQN